MSNSQNPSSGKEIEGQTEENEKQSSFSAYPLDQSTGLFPSTSDVYYIPVTPTQFPLVCAETESDYQQNICWNFPELGIISDPICHGFLLPRTHAEFSRSNENVIDKSDSFNQEHIEFNDTEFSTGKLEQSTTHASSDYRDKLILLLLQQIAQLKANQIGISSTTEHVTHKEDSSMSFVQQILPDSGYLPTEQSETSAFIIPVEAKLEDDQGYILHISPRLDAPSEANNKLTIDCPAEQIYLHPYTSTNITAAHPSNIQLPVSDLNHCVQQGSLSFLPDQNNDIANKIKGRRNRGFVLLSVKHEKVDRRRASISTSTMANSEYQDTRNAISDPTNYFEPISRARKNKKRVKNMKFDGVFRKRLIQKSSNVALNDENKDMVDIVSSSNLKPDDVQVSRFRVTRFADKRQSWIAPSTTGCLVVHDLWTRKMPDYVLANAGISSTFQDTEILLDKLIEQTDAFKSSCSYCQSTTPKSCDCNIQPSE